MQENSSCRQNKGDLSQNSAIPFTSPETKKMPFVGAGDLSFVCLQCFLTPAFTTLFFVSWNSSPSSFLPLCPSSASICTLFMSLQFTNLESFSWDLSVHSTFQSLPFFHQISHGSYPPFWCVPGFGHFSHLRPRSSPSCAHFLFLCCVTASPSDWHCSWHLA